MKQLIIFKQCWDFVRRWGFTLFYEDFGDVTFCCKEMGILSVHRDKNNLDNSFDDDDPDTILLIRLLAWHIKCKKSKTLKKELNEELMLVAWYPRRVWNICSSEYGKTRNRTDFYRVMYLVYAIWKYWNVLLQRLDVQKSFWICRHCDRKLCMKTWYSFLVWFLFRHLSQNI